VGELAKMISERFRRSVIPYENLTVSSIGTSAVQIMRQDPDRLGFVIINLSVSDIYIGSFRDVSATKGIKIPPSGGSAVALWDEDFETVGKEWFGVAGALSSALLITEYVAEGPPV
jgi:hypothetical protein